MADQKPPNLPPQNPPPPSNSPPPQYMAPYPQPGAGSMQAPAPMGYPASLPDGGPYYPPPPMQQGFVQPVMNQPVIIMQPQIFRQTPVNTTCPHCHSNIVTSTRADAGGLAWLICFIIAILGCWLGCCLIPFCVDDCQDITHSCPNCRNVLHVFKRL